MRGDMREQAEYCGEKDQVCLSPFLGKRKEDIPLNNPPTYLYKCGVYTEMWYPDT